MKHFLTVLFVLFSSMVWGQLQRVQENPNPPVELTFHAPRHISLLTVEPIAKKELHFSIMHTFNTIDNGYRNLWGIDNGANIRLSLEYGISERFSLGMGRSSLDKVFDMYGRYHLLRQTQTNSMPLSVSVMVGAAVNTSSYDFLPQPGVSPEQRWSYAAQLMLARKFSRRFSLQLSPMVAYFNDIHPIFLVEGTQNMYVATAVSAKVGITSRTSLTAQWIPNLNNSLRHNFGVGVDIEAGGHVFQLYFVTSPALNEPYLLAAGNGKIGEKFRLGFNVNRIFALAKRA